MWHVPTLCGRNERTKGIAKYRSARQKEIERKKINDVRKDANNKSIGGNSCDTANDS
jgi:hypothetical protein